MAEELIDSYVDRSGVKGDTDFMLASLREVYGEFKKLEAVKLDLKGATGLTQSIPAINQAKTGMDSLAIATQTVKDRIAQMNGKSKEFTDTLLKQAKAQKESAAAALNEAKAATESAKAKQIQAKNSDQVAKAMAAEKKLVDQASNDYAQLAKAYTDAALKAKNYFLVLGENHPITVQAIKDANDIGDRVKKADAAVGQFQRNVGNYSSAFNGLGMSFAQVGRELPSLAINVQTFALAISNNLPMVADELKKASEEIKRLRLEGKETPSMFQRVSKALFSFQTVLSIGITLLTLYAGRLFNVNDYSKQVKEATDKLSEAFNREKESVQGVIDTLQDYTEIDLLNLEARGAKSEQLNKRELLGAEQKLQQLQQLEESARKKRDEAEAKAEVSRNLLKVKALRGVSKEQLAIAEAENKAAQEEARKRQADVEKQEREIIKIKARFRKEDADKQRDAAQDNADNAKDLADRNSQASLAIEELRLQRIIDFNNEIAEDEKNSLAKRLSALQYAREAEIELAIRSADVEKATGEKTAKEIELIEAKKFDAILRIHRKYNQESLKLKDEDVTNSLEAAEKFEKEFNKTLQDRFSRDMARIESLRKANQKAGEDQLKDDEKFADAKKKLFEDLATELQDLTFTLLTANIERQKNEIQNQIDLIEKRKQADIEAANQTFTNTQERAAAIAVIEARAQTQRETLQRRQRDLDIKKAQFEKAASVARIIQETAMNVVKYIANPFLAALAAAVGAAQLATVIAQPIPRYKHGKNVNDLYEGPAIVGDGGRKEAIIRESGQVEITPDTPTLTYVGKRDIVLPDTAVLSDLVVSGKMGGKLVERTAVIENSNVEAAIKEMKRDVVGAIKKIPQPVISVSNVISQRVYHGDSSNQYLNKNLQG